MASCPQYRSIGMDHLRRRPPNLDFLDTSTRAGAIRTLESLARIEAGAQGGALQERTTTTTRTAKDGTTTTTVRERFTPPDWRADGWFLERRHPAEWSRRTELVVPDHEKAAEVDPLVGVHDELRLARLAANGEAGFFLTSCASRAPRSGPTGGQNGLARPFRTIAAASLPPAGPVLVRNDPRRRSM